MHIALRILPLLALFSQSARAQASWRDHVDPTRLREATDSFSIVVRGQSVGWQRLSWVKEKSTHTVGLVVGSWKPLAKTVGSPTWLMSDEVALTGVTQRSEVRFSRQMIEQGLRQSGKAGPTDMRITLDREMNRMTGSALTPSGGATAVPIDVAITDDVIDDNALSMVLSLIKWADGLTFTIPVLSSGKGTIETFTATTSGKDSTTVPAGRFETWRVSLASPQYVLDASVTTTAPYRVVRMAPRGAPMVAALVK